MISRLCNADNIFLWSVLIRTYNNTLQVEFDWICKESWELTVGSVSFLVVHIRSAIFPVNLRIYRTENAIKPHDVMLARRHYKFTRRIFCVASRHGRPTHLKWSESVENQDAFVFVPFLSLLTRPVNHKLATLYLLFSKPDIYKCFSSKRR